MNWKHMICLNLDQKRSIDEIHRRALDIKSHMQDCDDYTPLKLLEEQAMKAVVMCDECKLRFKGYYIGIDLADGPDKTGVR